MLPMDENLMNLPVARKGHFRLESGHHGNLWMDLELLCIRPREIQQLAATLSKQLSPYAPQAVCGPLVEGSFVALMVAMELDIDFVYADRFDDRKSDALYPVQYRLPAVQRDRVSNRRIVIVNDVINAGSAVRGAFEDLKTCGADVVAIGALLVLGSWAPRFAAEKGVSLESLAFLPNTVWAPVECPLCAAHIPLQDFVH